MSWISWCIGYLTDFYLFCRPKYIEVLENRLARMESLLQSSGMFFVSVIICSSTPASADRLKTQDCWEEGRMRMTTTTTMSTTTTMTMALPT